MDDELSLFLKVCLAVVLGVVALAFLCVGLDFTANNIQQYNACQELQEVSELEHHFDIWNGCIVKYNDYWFKPSDFPFAELKLEQGD